MRKKSKAELERDVAAYFSQSTQPHGSKAEPQRSGGGTPNGQKYARPPGELAMRETFFFRGQRCYADRVRWEPRLGAITRFIAHRVGADVEIRYDHAATLDRGMGEEVHEVTWFADDVYRRAELVLPALR